MWLWATLTGGATSAEHPGGTGSAPGLELETPLLDTFQFRLGSLHARNIGILFVHMFDFVFL